MIAAASALIPARRIGRASEPKRGLWVIAADDGGIIDYDRVGGLLAALAALRYVGVGEEDKCGAIAAVCGTFGQQGR